MYLKERENCKQITRYLLTFRPLIIPQLLVAFKINYAFFYISVLLKLKLFWVLRMPFWTCLTWDNFQYVTFCNIASGSVVMVHDL